VQLTNTLIAYVQQRLDAWTTENNLRCYIRPLFDKDSGMPDDMPHCCIQQRRIRDTVDFKLLAGWLQTCDKEHSHNSGLLDAPRRLKHMRFIDVRRRCIVSYGHQVRYAALSYTWGSQERYCLKRQNIQALEQMNALQNPELKLGPTIFDSIQVCERLCIPYLWIDSLCIVQDDAEAKHDQIQNMDEIYANAYLTLVASSERYIPTDSGDSRSTLDIGLSRVSIPAVSSQKSITVDGVSYAILPEDPCRSLDLQLARSVWFTRGWYVHP